MQIQNAYASDILWSRNGDPFILKGTDEETGNFIVDKNFNNVQQAAKNGIKNGLSPENRDAYNIQLEDRNIDDNQRKSLINDIHKKIKSMKQHGDDPNLIKYLESDLKYMIAQNNFTPENFSQNPISFDF